MCLFSIIAELFALSNQNAKNKKPSYQIHLQTQEIWGNAFSQITVKFKELDQNFLQKSRKKIHNLTYKVYCEFIPLGKCLNLKQVNCFLEEFSKKILNLIAPYISLNSSKHES